MAVSSEDLAVFGNDRSILNDQIDKAELQRLLGGHEAVALELALDLLQRLPGMPDINLIQPLANPEDLPRLDLDIGRLALSTAGRLVNHDPRIGQGEPFAGRTGCQQQAAHRGRLPDTYGAHRRPDVLHGVVDRETGGHDAAWAIDIERNILGRVLALQEQQLGADQGAHLVEDLAGQEDDPLLEEPGVDVVRA